MLHILTYYMVQDILWKVDSYSACKTIAFLYETRRFITMLNKAHHWTLSWASRIQLAPSIPISVRSSLMLSSHLRLGTYRAETANIPSSKSHVLFQMLRSCEIMNPDPKRFETFRKKSHFYGEGLLAPCPNPNLEDHPLSAVRDCLFNIFAASLRSLDAFSPSATWGPFKPWWQGAHLTWIGSCITFIFLLTI
jgi:hypothetical protein